MHTQEAIATARLAWGDVVTGVKDLDYGSLFSFRLRFAGVREPMHIEATDDRLRELTAVASTK